MVVDENNLTRIMVEAVGIVDDAQESNVAGLPSVKNGISCILPLNGELESLKDYFDALQHQTVDFESNIELVLVDEGSNKDVSEYCKLIESQHPENIVYVQAPNASEVERRNIGLRYSHSNIVTFACPGLNYARSTFARVLAFFRANSWFTNIVCVPIRVADAKSVTYDSVYKRMERTDKLVDLLLEPAPLPLDIHSAFFARDAIADRAFADKPIAISNFEYLVEFHRAELRYAYVSSKSAGCALSREALCASRYAATDDDRGLLLETIEQLFASDSALMEFEKEAICFQCVSIAKGVTADDSMRNYANRRNSLSLQRVIGRIDIDFITRRGQYADDERERYLLLDCGGSAEKALSPNDCIAKSNRSLQITDIRISERAVEVSVAYRAWDFESIHPVALVGGELLDGFKPGSIIGETNDGGGFATTKVVFEFPLAKNKILFVLRDESDGKLYRPQSVSVSGSKKFIEKAENGGLEKRGYTVRFSGRALLIEKAKKSAKSAAAGKEKGEKKQARKGKVDLRAELVLPRFKAAVSRKKYRLTSKVVIDSKVAFPLDSVDFYVGTKKCKTNVKAAYSKEEAKTSHSFKVSIEVPMDEITNMPIHNALRMRVEDTAGVTHYAAVKYNSRCNDYLALHSPYYKDKEHGLCAFFRQNVGMNTTFTIRHANVTDSKAKNAKLCLAWVLSKLFKKINPILLFEKNGQHYEESGRVVFERLVDDGYDNAWFVLRGDVIDSLDIDPKYKRRMLRQHSLKHYLYFFRCRQFLGSEALAHCLELRCQNLFVQRKLKAKRNWYIFLQHGVMYMVSLDSPQRSSFKRRNMNGHSFIVVSSRLEAQHFIDYAGFREKDLICCGLPKFDRSYLNPGADKILIMPTWRIWEFSSIRINPEQTKYVKMINRIIDAIPDNLKDKVVVAPHPLFNASTFNAGVSSGDAVTNYDELLRDVRVLITDYSSISYDSFYRGAGVLFFWEEKDECMRHYGGNTHIMIDENTAFGPVCMCADDVSREIGRIYANPQSDVYKQRFKQIVEFDDNCNTNRLIEAAKSKGMLS